MAQYEHRFRIGDAFPQDDPVARYLTVLAMVHNDWKRTMQAMNDSLGEWDGMGIRLYRFRQLAGHSHEARRFLRGATGHYPEVARFVDELPQLARDQYDEVFSALGGFEVWLGTHRNVTFHYPEMRPERYEAGQDPVAKALKRASEHEGSVTLGPTNADVRFDFADAVVAEMIGFDLNTDEGREAFAQLTTALRKSHWALGEFIRLAVEKHLADLPPGTVRPF